MDPDTPPDPELVEAAAALAKTAYLAGEFWSALRALHFPDALAMALVRDWHASVVGVGDVEWTPLDDDD